MNCPFRCIFLLCISTALATAGDLNQLTPKEKKLGWKLLFDGKTLDGWRNFKKQTAPSQGWVVEDGNLKLLPKGHGGDIITTNKFTDFDLRWDWRIEPKGNSGLKYLVTEERENGIGHEYQMVDDSLETSSKRVTASFYDVLPPKKLGLPTPIKEWNHSRLLIKGRHVEHWLNGVKVLEYKLGSAEIKAAVAKSKFKDVRGFGEKISGHILLTDHHEETWFRNIKIRDLGGTSSKSP